MTLGPTPLRAGRTTGGLKAEEKGMKRASLLPQDICFSSAWNVREGEPLQRAREHLIAHIYPTTSAP